MEDIAQEKKWYALYTRSRAEKKAYDELKRSGIECYLPLKTTIRQWSDRKKKVQVPIIHSYLFVNITPVQYEQVFLCQHIVRYVTFEGKAVAIPGWQINAMKKVIQNNIDFEVKSGHIKKGSSVRITTGPLKDVEGEVIDIEDKKRLLIRINHVGYSLVVKVPVNSEDIKES